MKRMMWERGDGQVQSSARVLLHRAFKQPVVIGRGGRLRDKIGREEAMLGRGWNRKGAQGAPRVQAVWAICRLVTLPGLERDSLFGL